MESRENNINVRTAVITAINYVKDLYAGSNLRDLMLEEVEFSEATNQWLVTVGFSLPETKEEIQSLLISSKTTRESSRRYKVVDINAATGEPSSMKIRTI